MAIRQITGAGGTQESPIMLDDFFVRALLAGSGVALMAGPLGCFIVWRKMAYFGDTLAHAALLGVALSIAIDLNLTVSIFVVAVLIALSLLALQKRANISSDALLGLLSHGSLAVGLVALALMANARVDMMGILFGDILAVSKIDLLIIWVAAFSVLGLLAVVWKQLFAATVSEDIAIAEGQRPERTNFVFLLLLAIVIAIAMKVVGVLLITALLIIPAAAARGLSTSPEQMAVLAILLGLLAVWSGLWGSLSFDTPSGPSIVVAALVLFLAGLTPAGPALKKLLNRPQREDASTGRNEHA